PAGSRTARAPRRARPRRTRRAPTGRYPGLAPPFWRLLEERQLGRAQRSQLAAGQARVAQRPDRHPAQPLHRMADAEAHLAHLPCAALPQLRVPAGVLAARAGRAQEADPGRGGAAPVDRNATPQALHCRLTGATLDLGLIALGTAMPGMGEPLRQFAVV